MLWRKTLTDGLVAILDSNRLTRLDRECVARQRLRVVAVREAEENRKQVVEQFRKKLVDEVHAWRQASEIRSYLAAITELLQAGKLKITDETSFARWMDWAQWHADDIDPIAAAPARSEFVSQPTRTPIAKLDLTRKTLAIVDQLATQDTDELFAVERAKVDKLCGRWRSSEWDEICRVLEGLGYPVAGRYRDVIVGS